MPQPAVYTLTYWQRLGRADQALVLMTEPMLDVDGLVAAAAFTVAVATALPVLLLILEA